MVVSIVQATRIKARIRVRNRQKAALRISRAARLYLGSKNLTSLRRKHAIAAGAKSVARQLRRRAGANAGNAGGSLLLGANAAGGVHALVGVRSNPRSMPTDLHLLDSPARGSGAVEKDRRGTAPARGRSGSGGATASSSSSELSDELTSRRGRPSA